MMNSHNKKIPTKYKWLKGFKNEMYEIRENLIKIDDFQHILKYIDEEDANNLEGKFFNHILCIEENKVLQILIKECEKLKLKIFALMFDGLVLYNDENFKMVEGILEYFSEIVAKNTIHKNIKFSFKTIESPIIMPDDYEAEKKEKKTQYEKIREDFEKTKKISLSDAMEEWFKENQSKFNNPDDEWPIVKKMWMGHANGMRLKEKIKKFK